VSAVRWLRDAAALLSALLLRSPAAAADPPAVEARHGMVAAAEPLAAAAGVRALEAGGNAIDAAVATGFALAVTFPVAGNLGGGGFLIAELRDGEAPRRICIDFRETAPAAATADLFLRARADGREDASTLGALAVAVPGSVAGLLAAHERHGKLTRAQVLAPAIALAEDGFPMTRRTARLLAAPKTRERLESFAASRRAFYPEGAPPAEGAVFRQPELARTLRAIAERGADGFYRGEVAERFAAAMRAEGGLVTAEDLAAYRPIDREPIVFPFAGHTVVTMPPPSSGGVCLRQMLAMIEGHPLAEQGHNSSASLHILAEAMRRSFADRNRFLGDPDHVELPLDRLLDAAYLAERAASIDPDRATPSAALELAPAPREREETTHYSVVDRDGSAVAVTTTLNGGFGSKLVVDGAGFLLNNEMDDFTTFPGEPNLYGLVQGAPNAIAPGKRPLSSMTPTILLDERGDVRAVLGTPGGPTIITNVLQVLVDLLVFDLPPQGAVNAQKIHHQHLPDRIEVEREIPADVRAALAARGHAIIEREHIGDFQLIVVDATGLRLGASDPRGGGAAVGY
jgi:gamma-glutamyltranspeptidase/glutathione hydrolase